MRRFTIIACLLVVLATSASAFATNAEYVQLNHSSVSRELIDFYGLQSVDSVPEWVTPMIVRSDAELKVIFDALKDITIVPVSVSNRDIIDVSMQSGSTYWVTANTAIQIPNLFGWMYINLDAHIQIYSYLSFREIIGSQQFTYLSGNTLGYGWTQTYAFADNHGTHINVYGGGVLDFYVIIDGGIKWYSQPHNLSLTYAVYAY